MKQLLKPPVSQFAQLFADFFPPAHDAAKLERIRVAKKFLAEKTAADKQRVLAATAAALAAKAAQDAKDPWSDFDRLAEFMARAVRPVVSKSRFSGVAS